MTEGPDIKSFAAWSPDGRYIAYLKFPSRQAEQAAGARLMMYDVDADVHVEIAPGDMRCGISRIAWKPKSE